MPMDSYFDVEITEHIATLNDRGRYTLELNIVSFNGAKANYDIRRWGLNAAGEKYPAKGIMLSREELAALKKQLNAMDDI